VEKKGDIEVPLGKDVWNRNRIASNAAVTDYSCFLYLTIEAAVTDFLQ
jgi:hypothetical protein